MTDTEQKQVCPHCKDWDNEIPIVIPDLPEKYEGHSQTVKCGVCGREFKLVATKGDDNADSRGG